MLALLAVALTACGPVGYLQQVHRRATEAVEEARRAGAESAAPYEYTSAVAYLTKAREEGDQAAYGSAIEFGRRAEEFAMQASLIARRQKQARPVGAPPGAGDAADATEPSRGSSP